MSQEILTLYSKCDGLPLSAAIFRPETETKGVVQISHGMAEHKKDIYLLWNISLHKVMPQ